MTTVTGSSSSVSSMLLLYQQLAKKAEASNTSSSKKAFTTAETGDLTAIQAAQAPPDITAFFKDADADGDGQVSKEEFSTAFQKLNDQAKTTLLTAQEQKTAADEIFAKLDSDGDGNITGTELAAAAPQGAPAGGLSGVGGHHHHGHHKADDSEDVSSLFNELDANGDGSVSQDELSSALDKMTAASSDATKSATVAATDPKANDTNKIVADLYALLNGNKAAQSTQTSAIFA